MALGALGVAAWFMSDAPALLAACASGAGLAWGARLAHAERRRPVAVLELRGDGSAAIDGAEITSLDVQWRGPLFALAWRTEGRARRRLAFPDALDEAGRRELRLWALSRRERAPAPAVAP